MKFSINKKHSTRVTKVDSKVQYSVINSHCRDHVEEVDIHIKGVNIHTNGACRRL